VGARVHIMKNGGILSRTRTTKLVQVLLSWSVWLWSGCAGQAHQAPPADPKVRPVAGSPEDVRSRPGSRDGYAVEACSEAHCLGVRGRGEARYPGMDRTAEPDGLQSWERLRAEVKTALQGVDSLHSTGFGAFCTGGTIVWLWDWRQVDQAIESLGTFLRTRNLNENIAVCVTAAAADELVRSARHGPSSTSTRQRDIRRVSSAWKARSTWSLR
jgi:hypothetical protein